MLALALALYHHYAQSAVDHTQVRCLLAGGVGDQTNHRLTVSEIAGRAWRSKVGFAIGVCRLDSWLLVAQGTL